MHGKIKQISELTDIIKTLRAEGKRVVLCHGVFDLLHIGHIRYLRRAREEGDVLVVTLTPDRFVDKGPHRPAFGEQYRAEALASLGFVDYVAINEWPTAEETLRLLRPTIYAKGAEFKNLDDSTGKIEKEAAVVKEIGATLFFVEDIVFSSSTLINRYLSSLSNSCQEYLELFRKRFSVDEIVSHIDSFSDMTAVVVGDAILDEYVYCSALGASSKDPVLALLHQSSETFVGGAAAVANHVAQFAKKVIFFTIVGDDNQEAYIAEHLAPNVVMHAITRPNSPTVRKSRAIDGYSFQKLLEIYHMERSSVPVEVEAQFISAFKEALSGADVVLAADFGNGCITEAAVEALCEGAPFLAVNTQANAGNRGSHTVGRYSRADFISLASHEICLQFRNTKMSTLDMMTQLENRMSSKYILVTEGRQGCAVLATPDYVRAPSFASNVVDRVGAGDALFSITALAAGKGLPADLIAFLGNIAGSLAVETIGNAKSIGKQAMFRYITSVLK